MNMKHITIFATIALFFSGALTLFAQESKKATIAIFPFKNLYGEEQYESLGWDYADSLEVWLNGREELGTEFELIPNIDVKDQMLAQNVDIKSPSYETDVWTIAEALEADKMIWGTYYVKYNKVFLKVEIIDLSINMPDPDHVAESKGLLYEDAVNSVSDVGEMLLPGLKW
ncbi:MAG: hypothetical protein KDD67_16670 [Ignavibacteriae bacterium]|nr:hypothetical protein [Ignavibacteriota bacterium]MCB9217365.1 hypothetical protein [Ignavibacteria bacterium]